MASKTTKKKIAAAIESTAKTVVDLLNDSAEHEDCDECEESDSDDSDEDEEVAQCVLKKGLTPVTVNVDDYDTVLDAFEANADELNFNPNRAATFKAGGRLVAADSKLQPDTLYVCDAKGEGKGN